MNDIKKSSKQEQRFYETFFKNRNKKSKLEYKTYTGLFESIKKRNYTFLVLKLLKNLQKNENVIIKVFQKKKKIKVDEKYITDEDRIAKQFNTYFTEIGPKLTITTQ